MGKEILKTMITFVDVSFRAYGAVVYMHCEYDDTTTSCRLISSKTKVAPLKTHFRANAGTDGSSTGTTVNTVYREYSQSIDGHCNVLLRQQRRAVLERSHGCEFRAFIANRIGGIKMNTEPAQWEHVPMDQNPADLCTRGRMPEELSNCALWWNGPEWLLDHRDRWPKMKLDNCPNDLPDKKTANRQNDSDKNVVEITCHHQRFFERRDQKY